MSENEKELRQSEITEQINVIAPESDIIETEDEFIPPERIEEMKQTAEDIPDENNVQSEDEFIPPERMEEIMQARGQKLNSNSDAVQAEPALKESVKAQEFKETPIVPVYPAEKPETPKSSDEFVQGDIVLHETYGKGTVTKIISYGDKVLCSIDFETAGKKLLDPSITPLQKA